MIHQYLSKRLQIQLLILWILIFQSLLIQKLVVKLKKVTYDNLINWNEHIINIKKNLLIKMSKISNILV